LTQIRTEQELGDVETQLKALSFTRRMIENGARAIRLAAGERGSAQAGRVRRTQKIDLGGEPFFRRGKIEEKFKPILCAAERASIFRGSDIG